MFVKLILPALLEAKDPGFRPIKPALEDKHVMPLITDDRPDLVVMLAYITSAYRAYQLADRYRWRGSHVALGGLHVWRCPMRRPALPPPGPGPPSAMTGHASGVGMSTI